MGAVRSKAPPLLVSRFRFGGGGLTRRTGLHKHHDKIALGVGLLILAGFATLLNLFQDEILMTTRPTGVGAAAPQELDQGQRLARSCEACHDLSPAARSNKIGPPLWNIVDSAIASVPHFDYSPAHRALGRDCRLWDLETLDRYLSNPRSFVPGNRMAFAGMRDPQERQQLLNFLATLRDPPPPRELPSTEAEAAWRKWAPLLESPTPELLALGRQAALPCGGCHDLGPQRHIHIGPPLQGVVGRPAAREVGFCYSATMQVRSREGLVWDEATLYWFLQNPGRFLPGTRMTFAGIDDPYQRVALLAYLKSLP
ncbi:MAG: hypothetical protein H7831_05025 [Magnetococcus sp. WYHC-3]